jgi:GT2 family glycosyltransferase/glycosyltransferase involved in cell wall biosynthesis
LKRQCKVAFATGSDDLIPTLLEEMAKLPGDLPITVVGEFPPPAGRWIPWNPARSFAENYERMLADLGEDEVVFAGIILQPNMPYWGLRWAALRAFGRRVVFYNDNLDHFMLRPRSLPVILRHCWWQTKNFVRWETRPGGTLYTWAWRAFHPGSLRRPIHYALGRWAGRMATGKMAPAPQLPAPLPAGLSVVIPTRNGRDLLERLWPTLDLPAGAEVILVDNGSTDGTAAAFPGAQVIVSAEPLSFAAAVNRGIAAARYSHVCLLNNDMVLEPGFFAALRAAFDRVPELFAATAQIFFPPGQRREETGKAMYYPAAQDHLPLRCVEPIAGEDLTWVLYGSGGCTLYDTAKLRALGAFNETFVPAYVEDLDVGYRGWLQGWPSVYVAGARVLHLHRSTTSKVFTPFELACAVERNYLRFLVTGTGPHFPALWAQALAQLNCQAAKQEPVRSAEVVLGEAWKLVFTKRTQQVTQVLESEVLALNQGTVAVFPGQRNYDSNPTVVVATPYLPYPLSHGGAVRMFNLMREASKTHRQVLLSFVEELAPPPAELLELCAEIVLVQRKGSHLNTSPERPDVVEDFDRADFRAALRWSIRKWVPSIVQLEFTQMALYAPDCRPAKTVLVEHDITLDLYEQLLEHKDEWETRRQHRLWVRFEERAWGEVDAIAVMSEKDRERIGRKKAVVIRNGVDLERFQPVAAEPEPRRLLFLGSFAHLPNLLALDFFLAEAWPLLENVTLHIIAGKNHERYLDGRDFARPGIELSGFVSDVRGAYGRAAVVLAPLVASAGTNIKVMEAMAMQKAIVSTPAGINGLDLTDGEDVLIARTGAEMATAIRTLLADPGRRKAMERAARRTAEDRYGWDRIGAEQAAMYHTLRDPYVAKTV